MSDDDYVLGIDATEVARLAAQHAAWRPWALDAWRRASFRSGQVILDVGCGPGAATVDLADLVGPGGRVVAIDRARAFLDIAAARARQREIGHVQVAEVDLAEDSLPVRDADGAWCRWVLGFLPDPAATITHLAAALRPGARFVSHEYCDYGAWRFHPVSPLLDELVAAVMQSWRDAGGEPDVGLALPDHLNDAGFHVGEGRILGHVLSPADQLWSWPLDYARSAIARLQVLGCLDAGRAAATSEALDAFARHPRARMIAPTVIEWIAVRRVTRAA